MADLSPAAQAVMIAATNGNINVVNDPVYKQCIAAALRVTAYQVTNPNDYEPLCVYQKDMWDDGFSAAVEEINRKLLAIAAELGE